MAKQISVRRVKSEDERYQGGNADYISLKEDGEKFTATALFLGDPTQEEPGYFEFFQHSQFPGLGYFPCAGDDCPLCEEGDKPKTRALTLWYDPKDDKVRIFEMNSLVIKQFSQMRAEEDKIYGRTFRITRADGNGNYTVFPKDVDLKKGEVKEKVKDAAIDLEEVMTNKLRKKMEMVGVVKALTDDDEEPTPKASKAKAKPDPEPDDDDAGDDDLEGEFTILKIDKKNEILTLEDDDDEEITLYGVELKDDDGDDLYEKGQKVAVTATKDSDGDFICQTIEAVVAEVEGSSEKSESEELPDNIEDCTMVITAVNAEQETLEVENDDLGYAFEMWFQSAEQYDGEEVDFDDYEVGKKITVSCTKDSDGDMIAVTIPQPVKSAAKAKAKK